MEIEIQLEAQYKEPKVIIQTDTLTEEIQSMIRFLSTQGKEEILGFKEGRVQILEPSKIYRIYSSGGKVFAQTKTEEFLLRLRLYELEEQLEPLRFVRISNSDIVNLKKVESFDLNFVGTICVTLLNGSVLYVSRRFLSKIKKRLGI